MSSSQPLIQRRSSIGDAAVDGLLHGAIAGSVMAIYLIALGLVTGTGVMAILTAFDLGQGTSPIRGLLIHLAVASIYGMAFGLLYRLLTRRGLIGRGGSVIIGLGYGLLLWFIMQIAFTAGVNIALSSLPAVHLAVAHGVYGALLGWLIDRPHEVTGDRR